MQFAPKPFIQLCIGSLIFGLLLSGLSMFIVETRELSFVGSFNTIITDRGFPIPFDTTYETTGFLGGEIQIDDSFDVSGFLFNVYAWFMMSFLLGLMMWVILRWRVYYEDPRN